MRMSRFLFVWLVLVLVPAFAFSQPPTPASGPPAPPSPSTLGNLRVSLLEGDIQIKTVDLGDWVPASINLPLKEGDELWVPEGGRLEIQVMPATYIRLAQKSSLAVVRVTAGAEQVYVAQGRAYVNCNPGRGGMLQIDTPLSSIEIYQKAVLKVDVAEEGFTDISLLNGTVYAESRSGKTTVAAGRTLSLKEGTNAELAPLAAADDWENWNKERDQRVFTTRGSSQYLPEELRAYASDFDNNGKWAFAPEYGNVWVPTGVAAQWAPYRIGRWIWIGGDYVWVSFEPWGWCPYHYGRWAYLATYGWFWVPPLAREVFWGPGYVGWVHTSTHVAWVPLAPREIYYGYGYFGPRSVNLYRRRIESIRIPNVYRNVRVSNAVTVVSNTTFVRGWERLPDNPLRYTDVGFRGNPFINHRIDVGRPPIRAERMTMVSINREISINRRPPERIRDINISRLREARHMVRDRNVSAFVPGRRQRP